MLCHGIVLFLVQSECVLLTTHADLFTMSLIIIGLKVVLII